MPIGINSKNLLEEMRKQGVDPSVLAGLERELDTKSGAEQSFNGAIMAQKTFNGYREQKDAEIKALKQDLANVASLTSAATHLDGDMKTQALARAEAIKKTLVGKGYEAEDINNLVNELVSDPSGLQALAGNAEPIIKKDEKEVPDNQNNNNGNYVDNKTFSSAMVDGLSKVASGGIQISSHIAAAMYRAGKLGIELPDDKLNSFGSVLISGMEQNKSPQEIIDQHFGFSARQIEIDKIARDAELVKAREDGAREALKEAGITMRKSPQTSHSTRGSVLDRKRLNSTEEKTGDSRIQDVKDLPKNEKGAPEYFRLRRFDRTTRRQEHTENAVNRFNEVAQQFDDQGGMIIADN